MSEKIDPITQMVMDALAGGYAISGESIQKLREQSNKGISTLKTVFWVAIGFFNIMIWVPFSTPIPSGLRWAIALGALLVALVFPIVGIRRHRGLLYRLEDSTLGPKRRNTDEAGRQYIDLVKKQGRKFLRAEYELLEGKPVPD